MVRNSQKLPDDFSEENYTNVSEKKELLLRELDVVLEKKRLLEKKIATAKKAASLREEGHPELALFTTQIDMDLIELDELIQEAARLNDLMKLL
ncbi:MAG: hypothetical protein AAGI90_02785 [Chlamydiota bacterium]